MTRRQFFLFRFRTQPTAHSFMRTLLSKRAHPERGRAVTPRSDFRFRGGNAASGGVRRACSQVRPPEGSVLAAGNWPGWEWPGRRDGGRAAAAAATLCQSGPGRSLWPLAGLHRGWEWEWETNFPSSLSHLSNAPTCRRWRSLNDGQQGHGGYLCGLSLLQQRDSKGVT